jgi:hypothetical protein
MADTQVSKTCALKSMWVRLPPAAQGNSNIYMKINSSTSKRKILRIISVFLLLLGGIIYFFSAQKNLSKTKTSSYSPPQAKSTTFQNILIKDCLNTIADKSLSGEINPDALPIDIKIADLKSNTAHCDSDASKYINIFLNEENSFMTISDIFSKHCCHAPSSLENTGKLIKTTGDINIFIHTGTWNDGPNEVYRPIIARGVKIIKLANGEEIKVIIDREIIDKSDPTLQKIEDKYQVIDPNFNTGEKVLTPEAVEKMLMDDFFSTLNEYSVVNKIETDLQNITLKD